MRLWDSCILNYVIVGSGYSILLPQEQLLHERVAQKLCCWSDIVAAASERNEMCIFFCHFSPVSRRLPTYICSMCNVYSDLKQQRKKQDVFAHAGGDGGACCTSSSLIVPQGRMFCLSVITHTLDATSGGGGVAAVTDRHCQSPTRCCQ